MSRLCEILTRHHNLLLVLLLVITMIISSASNQNRVESASVEIPVTETFSEASNAMELYRRQRDKKTQENRSSLELLCAQGNLDLRTREDASAKLQSLVEYNQAQTAMEGALLNSSLYPCIAVVTENSVTIVTEKTAITERDSALVMSLAAIHTSASPDNIRIITAEESAE